MRADPALARYRAALAVELRMQGYSYAELAEALGYTHRSAARKAVMRALDERTALAIDLYRVHRYLTCDDLHRRDFPLALQGNARALARCLRATKERASLAGMG